VVPSQGFCAEQTSHRRRTFQQSIMDQSFQINYTDVLAKNINRAH